MAELENLFALQDKNYREFHARLMPNIEKERIIGIRVPVLRKYAKELAHGSRLFLSVQKEKRVCNTVKENDCDNVEKFLNTLPHYYYEENNLHMFLIMQMRDYDTALAYLEAFLPYIDNWAVCDSTCMGLKTVAKHREEWGPFLGELLSSENPWAVRMGLVLLLSQCLTSDTVRRILEASARVKSEHYYVRMANAWLISVCYIKFPDETWPFLQDCPLDDWTFNKALQKITESYRVSQEAKAAIKSLKR